MENPILLGIQNSNLEETTALELQNKFLPFLEQAEQRKQDALAIVVTDASQKQEMKLAREMRLEIRDFMKVVEETRKAIKNESLRKCQAIDKVSNIIKAIVEPIEEYLERQEKFAQIQEANRKAELKAKRLEILAPYEITPERIAMVKLEEMTDSEFELFHSESESLQRFRIAEQERLANEAKEREAENKRLKEDNDRLLAESKAKDDEIARANKEKAENEAKQKAENEAKEKLQQDTLYRGFLDSHGCTPATKDQFTTKRSEDGTIILFKKVGEYKVFLDIDPMCGF